MIKTAWISRMAVWWCVAAACVPAWAQDDAASMRRPFSAPVTVAATGEASVGELSGVNGKMEQAVRAQLATLRFVPARRGGVAVPAAAYLRGSAVLTPAAGDTFSLHLDDLALAPRLAAEISSPRYPSTQARAGKSGTVELVLRVGANGRIKDVRTVASSDPAFDKAMRQALRRWRFQPLAGADDAEVRLPVWFYNYDIPPSDPPQFECALDPDEPSFAGQDGCMDRLEIVVSAARTDR